MEINDPTLKERLDTAELDRQAAVERCHAVRGTSLARTQITDETIERLAVHLRQAMRSDDPSFRKAYLRLFASQATVSDDEVRLVGPNAALAAAAAGNNPLPTDGEMVPSFVRKWRPRRDSNPRPRA